MVITGLTRNQLYLTVPWVRIPPSPPTKKEHPFGCSFFVCNAWVRSHSIFPLFAQQNGGCLNRQGKTPYLAKPKYRVQNPTVSAKKAVFFRTRLFLDFFRCCVYGIRYTIYEVISMISFRKTLISILFCSTLLLSFCGCGEMPVYDQTSNTTSAVVLTTNSTTTTATTTTQVTTTITTTTKKTTTKVTTTKVTTTKKSTTTKAAVVTTKETTAKPIASDGVTVYTTPKGKRYHYLSSCGGKNSGASTKEKAINAGLTPCQKCAQ